MDLLTLLTIGVLTGQAAALINGYSLGALGNSLAGVAGALYWGKYLSSLFDMSSTAGLVAGGILGAVVILVVLHAGEYFMNKKHHFFE